MMIFSDNADPYKGQGRARMWKVCGKEGIWNKKIRDHIEANHITGISILYDLCGKSCKSRNGLAKHKSRYHRSDH